DSLTGALTRAAGENVNSYTIDASALANGNYLITRQNGALTITQRPLTVTADAKNKVYGDADPALTYAVTAGNLVGADSLTGALTRAAGENVNSYTIDASALANGNYLITATNGSLTINKAPLTVTADNQARLYGAANPTFTTSVTGFVNGESALTAAGYSGTGGASTTATPTTNVGNATITASAGTLTATNYDFTTLTNGTLIINPAPLTVTANDASFEQTGVAYTGGNGVIYNGFVNGEGSTVLGGSLGYSGTSQGAMNAGSYVITPGGLTSSNYGLAFVNGTLTINAAPAFVPVPVFLSTLAQTGSAGNPLTTNSVSNQGSSVLIADASAVVQVTASDQPAAPSHSGPLGTSDTSGTSGAGGAAGAGVAAAPPQNVTPASLAQMTPAQIRQITPAQIASLDTPALQALQPSQVAVFSKQQVQALSTGQVQQLNLPQLQAMIPRSFASLSLAQATALLPAAKRDLLRLAAVARESGSSPQMDFRQANDFAQSLAPFVQQIELSEEFNQRVAAMPWNPVLAKLRYGEWPTFPGMQVGMVRVVGAPDDKDPLVRLAAEIGGYFSNKTAEKLFRSAERLIPVRRLLQGKAVRVMLDASPIVGNLLSLYTVTTGKDAFSGETVGQVERALAVLGTVPGGGALIKVAGKSSFSLVQKLLLKANQGKLTEIRDVGELAHKLVDTFQSESAKVTASASPEITANAEVLFKELMLAP
ncbi:MAG: MBG domain-containing protein, partial [Rhodoferax sp.]|nr:MBG domain-containing protein [Rhodoferax sp.]